MPPVFGEFPRPTQEQIDRFEALQQAQRDEHSYPLSLEGREPKFPDWLKEWKGEFPQQRGPFDTPAGGGIGPTPGSTGGAPGEWYDAEQFSSAEIFDNFKKLDKNFVVALMDSQKAARTREAGRESAARSAARSVARGANRDVNRSRVRANSSVTNPNIDMTGTQGGFATPGTDPNAGLAPTFGPAGPINAPWQGGGVTSAPTGLANTGTSGGFTDEAAEQRLAQQKFNLSQIYGPGGSSFNNPAVGGGLTSAPTGAAYIGPHGGFKEPRPGGGVPLGFGTQYGPFGAMNSPFNPGSAGRGITSAPTGFIRR